MRPLIVLVAAAIPVMVGAMAHAQSTSNPLILCSSISIQGNSFVCNQPLPTASPVATAQPANPRPTLKPTPAPTETPIAGPIVFSPRNTVTFNSLTDAAQTITFTQSNGGGFSAGQASKQNVASYTHGKLVSNTLTISPKGVGTTVIPITGKGGVIGLVTVTVNLPPTPQPTLLPTAAPTNAPTQAPTATPSPQPTVTPSSAPTATPTVAPTAPPTPVPTPVPTVAPVAIYPLAATLTVNGKPHNFTITQPGFSSGFNATSSNPSVATAVVSGGILTVTPHGPGTCTITVSGNGSATPLKMTNRAR